MSISAADPRQVAPRPSRAPGPTEPDLALYAFTAALSGGDAAAVNA